MTKRYAISTSCIIQEGFIFLNGETIFKNTAASPADFLASAYHHFNLNYPKFYKMDNLSKLGWLASELLLNGFANKGYQPEEAGVILSNANSSLDDDLKYLGTTKDIASPALFVYTLPNIVIGEICIRNNFKGEHAFYISDKFDAAFIENQVRYLLDSDILQACICGWADFLDKDYKAVLFLVEKAKGEDSTPFSAGAMNKIFDSQA